MDATALLSSLVLQHLPGGRDQVQLFTRAFKVSLSYGNSKNQLHEISPPACASVNSSFPTRLECRLFRKTSLTYPSKEIRSFYNPPLHGFQDLRALERLFLMLIDIIIDQIEPLKWSQV